MPLSLPAAHTGSSGGHGDSAFTHSGPTHSYVLASSAAIAMSSSGSSVDGGGGGRSDGGSSGRSVGVRIAQEHSRGEGSTKHEIPPSPSRKDALPSKLQQSKNAALDRRRQLASLLSGGIAGTFASTVTCPLEVVKTKLQSSTSNLGGGRHATFLKVVGDIARNEGARGFFRGMLPTWVGILPARATYFWAYSTTKSALSPHLGEANAWTHVASAASAGVVSNALTNPIWMVKTRMQLDAGIHGFEYTSYADACRKIFTAEGLSGFYKGLTASFWGVTEGALHFVVYERLKAWLQRRNREVRGQSGAEADKLKPLQYLLMAGASKFVASSLTYPHEVVRTRLREQGVAAAGKLPKYRSVPQALVVIGREEGRRGLYSGMGTHLLRVVPNTALMFLAYELVIRWIDQQQQQQQQQSSSSSSTTRRHEQR